MFVGLPVFQSYGLFAKLFVVLKIVIRLFVKSILPVNIANYVAGITAYKISECFGAFNIFLIVFQ